MLPFHLHWEEAEEEGGGSSQQHRPPAGARGSSAPSPARGTQAEANLTLGKQLAPPRRVSPGTGATALQKLWEETRLGGGHGESQGEGWDGLRYLQMPPEGRGRGASEAPDLESFQSAELLEK